MAVLNFVFCEGKPGLEGGLPVPKLRAATSTDITIGSSSVAAETPCPLGCYWVQLHAEAACRVAIGPSPTALATGPGLAAGQTIYLQCAPGDNIAAIEF